MFLVLLDQEQVVSHQQIPRGVCRQDYVACHGIAGLCPSFFAKADDMAIVFSFGWGGLASPVPAVSIWRVRHRVGRRIGCLLIHVSLYDYGALVALVDWSAAAASF